MAKEYIITAEVSKALDSLDWAALRMQNITRADVEAVPKAACQLAEGRATSVRITYSVPGIPEPREAQLITRRFLDQETGEYVLDPRVIVKTIDQSYELSKENIVIAGLYDENGRSYRLDPEKPEEKAIIDALLPVTERGRDGQERTYNCSICPTPLTVRYRSGKESVSYIGWDATSNRPVHRSAESLRSILLTEDGHCRLTKPLFGKGIMLDDSTAQALAEGRIVAAFGETNGKRFATALSFNIARGQVTEDYSKAGEAVRRQAYEYLRRQPDYAKGQEKEAAQQTEQKPVQRQRREQRKEITRKRGMQQTI